MENIIYDDYLDTEMSNYLKRSELGSQPPGPISDGSDSEGKGNLMDFEQEEPRFNSN